MQLAKGGTIKLNLDEITFSTKQRDCLSSSLEVWSPLFYISMDCRTLLGKKNSSQSAFSINRS